MTSFNNRRATTLMLPSYVEAEMPVLGDALHNALTEYRDSDAQCPTRVDWSDEDIAANAAMGNNAADLRSIQEQEQMADFETMRGNAPQMSEADIAQQMAEEAKPEYNVFFGDDVPKTMEILTCDEEDAEVGRLWGIDASRTEGGE